jgi:ABC-2 type transport system permease protein
MNTALMSTRNQLSAIAELRWRMFLNSLRTTRGQMELLSRMLVGLAFTIGGLGGAIGLGVAAYLMISSGRPEFLPVLFWFVFLFWQGFPIVASALGTGPDSSDLLRFPLSYRAYTLVRVGYGAFDPATALGTLWSCGILLGVVYAKPALFAWAPTIVLIFGVFNVLFMQMLFSWLERWLAQRRTREVMSVLFLLLILSLQLIGPMMQHFGRRSGREMPGFFGVIARVQGPLPPGLAGDAIVQGIYPRWGAAFAATGLLCAFVLLVGYLLHVRLRAQYRGENLSEVGAASTLPRDRSLRLGWDLPGLPSPLAAVFEKEVRYILRSGPMLLNLIMPVFVLLLFRFGAANPGQHAGAFLSHAPDLAFPAMAAYTLLMLTNLVCNSFGGDSGGMQFYFAAPVNFRQIVLAKNLTHGSILALEVLLAWIAVSYFYGTPGFEIVVATLAGLLFAVPLILTAGNLLSVYWPKRMDFFSFRGQRPAQTSALIILLAQLFVVGISVSVFVFARHFGSLWIAILTLVVMGGVSVTIYKLTLDRMDCLIRRQQEGLLAELCRA